MKVEIKPPQDYGPAGNVPLLPAPPRV
jgi:hypothetical protein